MITVRNIFDAYLWFQPYNPGRDSETVVIHNSAGTSFLHWDKGAREFTPETERGKGTSFPGEDIDSKGLSSRQSIGAQSGKGFWSSGFPFS